MLIDSNHQVFPAGRQPIGIYLADTAGPCLMTLQEIEATAASIPPGGRLLELGTWCGAGAAAIADRRPDAEIVSVDTFQDHPYGPILWWINSRRNMRLFLGRTGDFAAVARPETFDAVLVDADHSAAGTLRDLRIAEALATPRGAILAHDYADPNWPGVGEAIAAFTAGPPWRIQRIVGSLAILGRHAEG